MSYQVTEWISNLSRLGVKADYDDEVSRRIVFSNVIFLSLPMVYLLFMIIDYDSYSSQSITELRFDQFVVPLIILVCFFCLMLNKYGHTTLSRVIFIGLWPLLLHLIPIKILETPADYYLAFPFGVVFHSMLIQLMFSHRKDAPLFWTCLVFNLATMILSPALLMYFDLDGDIPKEMINYKYYFYDGILYWLLFNLVTFYIQFVIESYIKGMGDSKILIEKQKDELNALNHNLEALVSQRTSELEEQNEKLKNYAFFNAHLLRGPFCRVQGLIHLQNLAYETSADLTEIRFKLNESIEELNTRIREIQRLVEPAAELQTEKIVQSNFN